MDSSVQVSKRFPGFVNVSSTDFFYPLVEDPYDMGRVAAANVLSDIYAMGVTEVDNVLMILGASTDMQAEHRKIVTRLMIKGFDDHCKAAGTVVSGGQSVLNPWPIIGGTAVTMCQQSEVLMPIHARAGDVLLLTKPLGTQLAVNLKQWSKIPEKFKHYRSKLFNDGWRYDAASDSFNRSGEAKDPAQPDIEPTIEQMDATLPLQVVLRGYNRAVRQMIQLNRPVAEQFSSHDVHAATDVTGFGILGHADNLVKLQTEPVDFIFDFMPVIRHMKFINENCWNFKLTIGKSAETSGGILMALPADRVASMMQSLESRGISCWKVGRVVEGLCCALPSVILILLLVKAQGKLCSAIRCNGLKCNHERSYRSFRSNYRRTKNFQGTSHHHPQISWFSHVELLGSDPLCAVPTPSRGCQTFAFLCTA